MAVATAANNSGIRKGVERHGTESGVHVRVRATAWANKGAIGGGRVGPAEHPHAISAVGTPFQTAPALTSCAAERNCGEGGIALDRPSARGGAARRLNPICRIDADICQAGIPGCRVEIPYRLSAEIIGQAMLPAIPCINLRIVRRDCGECMVGGRSQTENIAARHPEGQAAGRRVAGQEAVPYVAFGHPDGKRGRASLVGCQYNRLGADVHSSDCCRMRGYRNQQSDKNWNE